MIKRSVRAIRGLEWSKKSLDSLYHLFRTSRVAYLLKETARIRTHRAFKRFDLVVQTRSFRHKRGSHSRPETHSKIGLPRWDIETLRLGHQANDSKIRRFPVSRRE